MKKLLFLLLISCLSFQAKALPVQQPRQPQKKELKKEAQVYICDSRSAYAYHFTRSCRGLNRCTHGVIKMKESDARNNYGRSKCKICG
jgi:hypothetical protein